LPSRFTKKPEQQQQPAPAVAEAAQRYRFTRYTGSGGGPHTAPSSPETHKEEDTCTAAEPEGPSPAPPSSPLAEPRPPNKSNPVLVHVADYVSSDCVDDSVDESDDQRSSAPVAEAHGRPSAGSLSDDIDDIDHIDDKDMDDKDMDDKDKGDDEDGVATGGAQQVTASKSDGHIYGRRRCEEFDASTTSLNRQTQCCMSFKPKPSRRKSQSHSCHVV